MVLTYGTIEKVEDLVRKGLPIGHYGKDSDLTALPKMLGEWNVKTITEDRNPGTGYVVVVPSNMRTRLIYKEGRLAWLQGIGFTKHQALLYYRACNRVKKKWDLHVAEFVLANFNIDRFVAEEILSHNCPKEACRQHSVYCRLSNTKIVSGCQILVNIRGLK